MSQVSGRTTIDRARNGHPAPLRCAIVADGDTIHEWERRCIHEAVDAGLASIAAVIVTSPLRRTSHRSRIVDRAIRRFSRALQPVDLAAVAGEARVFRGAGPSGAAFDFLTGQAPDFVLALGDAAVPSELIGLAPLGVWSFRFGADRSPQPQAAALDASRAGSPTVTAALVMTSGDISLLNQGTVGTFGAKPAKTVDRLCFSVAPWLRRACADMLGNAARPREPSNGLPDGIAPPRPLPLLLGMARGLIRAQAHYRLTRQQWNVGLIAAPIGVVAGLEGAEAQRRALDAVQWMPEVRGQFFADPFGHEVAPGVVRIFFELFDWARGLGLIAISDHAQGRFSDPEIVLGGSTHLSYPFVTDLTGTVTFVPEHSAATDVAIHSIDRQGHVTGKKTIIADAALLDCTFLSWNDRIWMFAIEDRHASNAELHLFHADRIDGEWRPHPLNPVKTDVGSARPGGTPFVHRGKLYRPAQDCSTHYGRGTVINEIMTLSETDYRERTVSRVDPPAGSRYDFGLHTISQVNDVTIIDGARQVIRWAR